jgi:NADH dehydrogenase
MSRTLVIVGGGFAGFWAAMAARRMGGTVVDVRMVSPAPDLQIRPRLYESDPETLSVDLAPLLAKTDVEFVRGEALGLDVAGRRLRIDSGELAYDRLVVATGSRMRRPPVPGGAEAFSIDTQTEAIAFDLRLAEIAKTNDTPSIAVVGAGFTGIELALELRDRIARHGDRRQAERLRVVLIDRAPVVGRALGPGPRPVIESALADARVELLLGATVTGLGSDRVVLADGTRLDVDAVVLTTGLAASEFTAHVPGPRDQLNRIVVDRFLRAREASDIFVAGDAAAADGGDGHRVLQSCQHALQLGRFAGENAARDVQRLPLVSYVQPPYITCLDLGRSGAVLTRGWNRSVEKVGAEAKDLKRRINTQVIYPPEDATREELLALSRLDPAEQKPSSVRTSRRLATARG